MFISAEKCQPDFSGENTAQHFKKRKVLCNIIDTEVHISASVKNEIQDL